MVYLSVTYQIQIHIQIQQNIHLIPSLLGLRDTIIWHFACHNDDDNSSKYVNIDMFHKGKCFEGAEDLVVTIWSIHIHAITAPVAERFLITRSSHRCVWCGFEPRSGHM